MEQEELTNIVYDTLMGNTQHKQLDLHKIAHQEVDSREGTIEFDYLARHVRMSIEID